MNAFTVATSPSCDGARALFITNECAGLGHLRRSINLARAVTERNQDATALIVTGSSALGSFELPNRVDTVKLPVFRREADGTLYAAALGVDMSMIESLRSEILRITAVAFDPDIVVVDKTPLGLRGELVPMLEQLRTMGRSRVVLGLRNVEDEPTRVRADWSESNMLAAVERYYDCAVVYGPSGTTADALSCLAGTPMPVPVSHVGFVGRAPSTTPPNDLPADYLLVTVGGGADGYEMISAVLDAEQHARFPFPVVVVTGPLMASGEVAELATRCDGTRIRLFEFRHDMPQLLAGALAVVTMGGYNTISEVLQTGVPALVIPRVRPSAEQLIRANELVALDLVDMLHPDSITPERMWAAVRQATHRPRRPIDRADYGGAERTAEILIELLNQRHNPSLALT